MQRIDVKYHKNVSVSIKFKTERRSSSEDVTN